MLQPFQLLMIVAFKILIESYRWAHGVLHDIHISTEHKTAACIAPAHITGPGKQAAALCDAHSTYDVCTTLFLQNVVHETPFYSNAIEICALYALKIFPFSIIIK